MVKSRIWIPLKQWQQKQTVGNLTWPKFHSSADCMLTIDIQEAIHVVMMYFDWNNGKNELLKKERNGSF